MSQLHQEALRRQHVVDKRNVNDLSWLATLPIQSQKGGSSQCQRNSSSGLRSVHNTSTPSHSVHSATRSTGLATRSSNSRSKEIVITDPYLDALTKETKARTRNRLTSTEYMMQW
ncbi:hypothetical protein OS493_029834 [Desmophyllum pertusum]|uniref:Uncharacterized protein n=1 Tax=Desmophyllum pertusum TaxID=174260 RepID=A0A9W9YLG7_9CNID|nr:hypothetical protein OS493_029834 [Desmophyllum pertusum]